MATSRDCTLVGKCMGRPTPQHALRNITRLGGGMWTSIFAPLSTRNQPNRSLSRTRQQDCNYSCNYNEARAITRGSLFVHDTYYMKCQRMLRQHSGRVGGANAMQGAGRVHYVAKHQRQLVNTPRGACRQVVTACRLVWLGSASSEIPSAYSNRF